MVKSHELQERRVGIPRIGSYNLVALLGLLSALTLLVCVVVLTGHMDSAEATREGNLLSKRVDEDIRASATSMNMWAKNDEAVRRLDHARDAQWATSTFPSFSVTSIWTYTFDRENQFISGQHESAPSTANYPSWSISAEFFAYLLFPALAWLALRTKNALPIGLALFAFAIFASPPVLGKSLFELTAFSLPRIVPEFVIGIGLYQACRGREISALMLGLGALIPVVPYFGANWMLVLGFAWLIALLYMGDIHLRGLPLKALTHLGLISYAIYMVHGLVEMVGFKVLEKAFGYPETGIPLLFLPLMLAATIASGHYLHAWVEVGGRNWILRSFARIRSRTEDDQRTSGAT